ncbi:MAG TPA: GxxExxY protein [Verrucomicrobiae bacterium]|nr:GxxExxY protein [Verrucomicrobiae bacterium]
MNPRQKKLNEEEIGKIFLDSAFKVHTALGPGLLESVYEAAIAFELINRGLIVERQKPIPVKYEGQVLDIAFRADLIVNGLVLVELKSVETITPLFKKISTNYVRLASLKLGFLLNFNEVHLKNGITRLTNGLEGKDFFAAQDVSNLDFRNPSLPSYTSPPSRET